MDSYSLKDFNVSILFNHPTMGSMSNSFDVLAYTKEDAENEAFSKWSELGYEHVGTLTYITEEN